MVDAVASRLVRINDVLYEKGAFLTLSQCQFDDLAPIGLVERAPVAEVAETAVTKQSFLRPNKFAGKPAK